VLKDHVNEFLGLGDGILVGDKEVSAVGVTKLSRFNGVEEFFIRGARFNGVEEFVFKGGGAFGAVGVRDSKDSLEVSNVGDGKAMEVDDMLVVEA
jgi:hypothetical protein